jgi:hypothetical protein
MLAGNSSHRSANSTRATFYLILFIERIRLYNPLRVLAVWAWLAWCSGTRMFRTDFAMMLVAFKGLDQEDETE